MENKKQPITVMSILTYYADQIFDGTKPYEFRKSPLKEQDMHKPIYIYSAKGTKAIIGSFEVDKIHKGSLRDILRITGYDKRPDRQEIVDYFSNTQNCYALEVSNVQRFEKPITLKEIKRLDPNVQLPQYYSHYAPGSTLYRLISQKVAEQNKQGAQKTGFESGYASKEME